MRDEDILGLVLMIGLLVIVIFVILALTAGNIVNQLFAPVPSISGPLGAGAALVVFIFLLLKSAEIVFR